MESCCANLAERFSSNLASTELNGRVWKRPQGVEFSVNRVDWNVVMGTPMSRKIRLDLIAGGHFGVELRPPGPAPSAYFIFMRGAGGQWIWPLVQKVLYTAGQPICDYVAL